MKRRSKKIEANAEFVVVPQYNYGIAMAAGEDAANRAMKADGRTRWNARDFAVAARRFNLLIDAKWKRAKVEVTA